MEKIKDSSRKSKIHYFLELKISCASFEKPPRINLPRKTLIRLLLSLYYLLLPLSGLADRTMGNTSSKGGAKITAQDRAILE